MEKTYLKVELLGNLLEVKGSNGKKGEPRTKLMRCFKKTNGSSHKEAISWMSCISPLIARAIAEAEKEGKEWQRRQTSLLRFAKS